MAKESPHSPESPQPLIIGVDLDQTVTDYFEQFITRFNRYFGTNVRLEEVTKFDFTADLIRMYVPNPHEAQKLAFLNHSLPENYKTIEPIRGVMEVLPRLALHNTIHFLSGRPLALYEVTRQWLERYGLFSANTIINLRTEDEDIVEFKARKVKQWGINLLIEDQAEVATAVDIPVLLLDYPWNRSAQGDNITRISGWHQVVEVIARLKADNKLP